MPDVRRGALLWSRVVGRCLVCRGVLRLDTRLYVGPGLAFAVLDRVVCDCGEPARPAPPNAPAPASHARE